jgi:hypothetical protein
VLEKAASDVDLLADCNQYRSLVGALLYLTVNTRPDISYAVGALSRFINSPTTQHMKAAKNVLRYLYQNPGYGLFYSHCAGKVWNEPYNIYEHSRMPTTIASDSREYALSGRVVEAYGDADFAGSINTRKSTTGMVIIGGCHLISWGFKLQSLVTTSATEAEFVAAASATKEGLWLVELLKECMQYTHPFQLHCDNKATLHLIKNKTAGISGRTKHMEVQFMFVRGRAMRREIIPHYQETEFQLADALTKPVSSMKMKMFRTSFGMRARED